MKKLLLIIVFPVFLATIALIDLSAQEKINYYEVEERGYFTNPVQTPHGVVCTDNYSSRIYLIQNGELEVLVESRGCGRYLSYSHDKGGFAYKKAYPGCQSPHTYSLLPGRSFIIDDHVELCGQPTLGPEGVIVYTIGDTLVVFDNYDVKKYNLGFYVNLISVSKDGKRVAFADKEENISIFNVDNEKIEVIEERFAQIYPGWSPDGKFLTYNSIGGELFLWDGENKTRVCLGQAGSPAWSSDSKRLIYQKNSMSEKKFSSDLYLYDLTTDEEFPITSTNHINECNPSLSDGYVLYHTFDGQKIFRAKLNINNYSLEKPEEIFSWPDTLNIKYYPDQNRDINDFVFLGESPYVNQMYDTPDFHDGTGSCGPTTALMTLAFYNRLPEWPTEINKLYPHINNYGAYIADFYHFNEYYYNTYTNPYGSDSWGAYSYMWSGSGSPNSTMASYYENHLFDTEQGWTTQCSFQNTVDEIDAGYPQTICAFMTVSGHILMAKGYNDVTHSLIFHDPFGDKNTPDYPSYDGNDVVYDWPGYNNGNQNLDPDGSHGGVAWTIKTQSDIPLSNDTIIDDMDFGNGFYIYNEPPSHMKYFRDMAVGYKGHSWWTVTITTEDVCYVTWEPEIPEHGFYEVSAYIPYDYSNAQNSIYKLNLSGLDSSVIINQNEFSDEWVLLGWFELFPDSLNQIYLGDSTGIFGEYIAYDAIKFSRTQTIGVEEITFFDSKITLYPNPSSDIINISIDHASPDNQTIVEIFNLNMQLVDRLQFNNGKNLSFSVADYKNGSYLLKLNIDENFYYSRFVVLH